VAFFVPVDDDGIALIPEMKENAKEHGNEGSWIAVVTMGRAREVGEAKVN
jgi:hypothetical protein